MGITVDMFCKNFKANSKAKDKTFEDFIKKHITTDYIDYLTKDVVCSNIVTSTTRKKDGDRELISINSSARYVLFVMNLISSYTDIQIDFKDGKFVEQYDALNKIGAIDAIIAAIPEGEYTEFSTLLNMKMDDFRDNEYSITALLYNLKQSFSLVGEVFEDVLNRPEIKKLIEEIQDMATDI